MQNNLIPFDRPISNILTFFSYDNFIKFQKVIVNNFTCSPLRYFMEVLNRF